MRSDYLPASVLHQVPIHLLLLPASPNGPVGAINGRLEHLRGIAQGFRNLDHYILRSLLHSRKAVLGASQGESCVLLRRPWSGGRIVWDDPLVSASWASSERVRKSMKANRSRDTGPELRLRSELHSRGLRYFVDRAPIKCVRRRADIVFPRKRVAVFVDGCFWHGCPQHHTFSKTNPEFWRSKVERNVSRDRDTDSLLAAAGWMVVRCWEHESVDEVADRIERLIRCA